MCTLILPFLKKEEKLFLIDSWFQTIKKKYNNKIFSVIPHLDYIFPSKIAIFLTEFVGVLELLDFIFSKNKNI